MQNGSNSYKRGDDQPTPNSWNIEIFVDVVKELVPTLHWKQVILELDHPGFLVKNPDVIRLILLAFHRATSEMFPIEAIYKPWNNPFGQVS